MIYFSNGVRQRGSGSGNMWAATLWYLPVLGRIANSSSSELRAKVSCQGVTVAEKGLFDGQFLRPLRRGGSAQ